MQQTNRVINIGFGNVMMSNRIIAIVSPESAPIKRLVSDGRDKGIIIDATYGRRTRSVIITDSDYIVLSSIQPETIAGRIAGRDIQDTIEIDDL